MAERTLRIFVSSPSDVAAERARVKLVADRLNAQLEGVVRLDVLRWEDAFYTAAHSFQQAIDGAIGNMSATDMVLCIVWKRAGLKLNPSIWRRADGSPYESGTVLEFETAVEVSRKHNGVPDVYLFRKSAPVVYEADRVTEQLEQYQLLQAVWKRWTESDGRLQHRRLSELCRSRRFRESSSRPACGNGWSGAASSRTARSGIAPSRARRFAGWRPSRPRMHRSSSAASRRSRAPPRSCGRAVPARDRRQRLGQVLAAARGPHAAG